jgi:hypothetical protein
MEQHPASMTANAMDETSFAIFISFLFFMVLLFVVKNFELMQSSALPKLQLTHTLPFNMPHLKQNIVIAGNYY